MTHGVKTTQKPFTVTSYLHRLSYQPANFDQIHTSQNKTNNGIVHKQQIQSIMIDAELSVKLADVQPYLANQ